MKAEEILESIKHSLREESTKASSSMGVSESFYNPYYLIGMAFTDGKNKSVADTTLVEMSETELNNLVKLAEYASDVFY